MILLALAGAISIAAGVAERAPAEERPGPWIARRYPSPADAVRAALASQPVVVVGFGELHQTVATAGIRSALRRFTEEIFPDLADQFSHLVIETWIANGRCGEAEHAVTADVEKTTSRPAATETEIGTLIRRADEAGVVPRILSISCADYQAMRSTAGAVDYDKTLKITARALLDVALRGLRHRWRPDGPDRPLLGIYGGALHNDRHPEAGLEPYTFAPGILAATLGRYLEIDLVVPEYAAGSATARSQGWWKAYLRTQRQQQGQEQRRAHMAVPGTRAGGTVMVSRGPRSFVIVFPPTTTAR